MTRVLVVEDEESFSDALSFMLRKEGFEVGIAVDRHRRRRAVRPDTAPTSCCSTSCCPACPAPRCAARCASARTCRSSWSRPRTARSTRSWASSSAPTTTSPSRSPRASSSRASAPCCGAPASPRSCCPPRSRPVRCAWTSSATSSRSTASAVSLPLKEFELLELLLRNAGRVLTRGQLIDRVWGSDYVGDGKTLDVHVKRLRAKIEADPAAPRAPRHRARPRLQVRGLIARRLRTTTAPGSLGAVAYGGASADAEGRDARVDAGRQHGHDGASGSRRRPGR